MDYLTTHTSLSPIRCGFAPGFVSYKKRCTPLAATSDKVYQLLAHGRWFSVGILASSITKTGRHDIAEILLKMVLNTINQINQTSVYSENNSRSQGCSVYTSFTVILYTIIISLIDTFNIVYHHHQFDRHI